MLMLQLVVKNLPPEMAEILQIDYRAYCTEVGKSKIQIHTNTKYRLTTERVAPRCMRSAHLENKNRPVFGQNQIRTFSVQSRFLSFELHCKVKMSIDLKRLIPLGSKRQCTRLFHFCWQRSHFTMCQSGIL